MEKIKKKPVQINFAAKPTNKNPPKSSNPAAEKQVDELTSALMTNLENGTASDGPVATVKAESLGNCHKCNLPIEGYDSACSVSIYIVSECIFNIIYMYEGFK